MGRGGGGRLVDGYSGDLLYIAGDAGGESRRLACAVDGLADDADPFPLRDIIEPAR